MSKTVLITTELAEDVDDPSRPRFGGGRRSRQPSRRLALAIQLELSILVDFARGFVEAARRERSAAPIRGRSPASE